MITLIDNVVRKVFRKNPFTLKLNFNLKLLEIHLKNKKNMIRLIKSMEEVIHQKKSN